MLRRGTAIAVLLGGVVGVAGCSGCSDDEGQAGTVLTEDPIFRRYPSSITPYRVRDGAAPPRSIWYRVGDGVLSEDIYPLTATVAIDARTIGIVFPPDDRVGFDLAIAGIDRPWTRVSLVDTPLEAIGALDAVATPDGSVHVVFRERGAPKTLTHVTVTRAGGVSTESVPRPGPAEAPYPADRCPDVTLGVTPAGELDMVFRHDVAPSETQLLFARRRGGAWTTEELLDTRDVPRPANGVHDYGCRNVLAYDDTDEPVVLSLARRLPAPWTSPEDIPRDAPNSVLSLLRGVGGVWHPVGPQFVRPERDAAGFRGELDLVRHPRGVLLGATSYNEAEMWLSGFALRQDFGANPNEPIGAWRRRFERDARIDLKSGGKLVINKCGGAGVLGSEVVTHDFVPLPVPFQTIDCRGVPDNAPVIHTTDIAIGPLRQPSYTHGDTPYTAASCIGPGRELAVCFGQYEQPTTDLPPRLPSADELPRFAETSVADGATDVAAGLDHLTFRMAGGLLVGSMLHDVSEGRDVPVQGVALDDATGAITTTYAIPLLPGHRYRLTALAPPASSGLFPLPWQYVDVPFPSISFQVAGSLSTRADPRAIPMKLICTGTRGADGVCDLPDSANPLAGGATFVLAFDRRFDAVDTSTGFRILDASKTPTPYASFKAFPLTGELQITWTGPLRAGETHTIELPAIADIYGQSLATVDRTVRFVTTTSSPPAVIRTTPAANATGVATNAPLFVEFNEPMNAATLIAANVQLRVYQVGSPLSLTLTMDTPSRLRIVAPPLTADTAYELDLSAAITDATGQALVGAPASILFRTAP